MTLTGVLIPCETLATITIHLRILSAAGPKYGGGADTKALCGAPASWDLRNNNIEIARCQKCRLMAGLVRYTVRGVWGGKA